MVLAACASSSNHLRFRLQPADSQGDGGQELRAASLDGEEEEDFQRFCASIGETPSDPDWADLMEDGELDFFDLDDFPDVEPARA